MYHMYQVYLQIIQIESLVEELCSMTIACLLSISSFLSNSSVLYPIESLSLSVMTGN